MRDRMHALAHAHTLKNMHALAMCQKFGKKNEGKFSRRRTHIAYYVHNCYILCMLLLCAKEEFFLKK